MADIRNGSLQKPDKKPYTAEELHPFPEKKKSKSVIKVSPTELVDLMRHAWR